MRSDNITNVHKSEVMHIEEYSSTESRLPATVKTSKEPINKTTTYEGNLQK